MENKIDKKDWIEEVMKRIRKQRRKKRKRYREIIKMMNSIEKEIESVNPTIEESDWIAELIVEEYEKIIKH